MKEIQIQNCTKFTKSNMFKVTVNGEEHIMYDEFLSINMPEDASLEVKVKYGNWNSSSTYKFESKDNILLQISVNHRVLNWALALTLIPAVLIFVIGYFYGSGTLITTILLPFPVVYHFFRGKKYFFISEKRQLSEII